MQPSLLLAGTLGAGLFLTGCVDIELGPSDGYQENFHYSYDLQPGGRISLENFNGAVEIAGWDQNKVEVTGVRYASSQDRLAGLKIQVRNEEGSLDIRTEGPSEHRGNTGARYALQVPRTAVLDRIVTSNGHIRVRDLDSGGSFKTSNGSIRAENLHGKVDARTSNGSIELHGIAGGASMKTSNGRIRAEDIGEELSAETSNGSIDLMLPRVPANGVRAETSNGPITVALPSDAAARLEANTSNSSVSSELDVAANINGTNATRNHLAGNIGAGGPLIGLSTRNGKISLLRR